MTGQSRALWEDVADEIRAKIDAGALKPGDQVPGELELAEQHGLSRTTIRAALTRLIQEGLITEGQGKRGRRVRGVDRLRWNLSSFESGARKDTSADDAWNTGILDQGKEPHQDIEVRREIAAPDIQEYLNIDPSSVVVVRDRIRYANGEPYQLSRSYFPLDIATGTQLELPGDQTAPGGLLARAGHPQRHIQDTIRCRMPSQRETTALRLPPATPVIEHIRVGYGDSRPVRVMSTIAPGDRWELHYDISVAAPTYRVRHATRDDLDELFALRAEGERWLKEAGIEQWTWTERAKEIITAAVENNETFALEDDGEIVASVTLSGPDRDFWHDADEPEQALYVYKLMVRRSHKGSDLGGALLDWSGRHAAKLGKQWIRLDIWRTNQKLADYYMGHGFEHVRTEEVQSRKSGALFQRDATVRTRPDITIIGPEDALSQEG